MLNPIEFWNDVALECNRFDHTGMMMGRNQQGPTLSSRALAIVHIAIHDAYVVAKRQTGTASAFNDPYLPAASLPSFNTPPGPNPLIVSAAVSAAAAATLGTLYPSQASLIDSNFRKITAMNGDDESGHRVGQEIAKAVIRLRNGDGSSVDPDPENPGYQGSAGYGRHRADPLNAPQPYLGWNYGSVRLFACNAWHVLKKYPEIGTPAYIKDHREVRSKGAAPALNVANRTPDETIAGIYWAYDGAHELGTPPRLYLQIIRKLASAKNLDQDELNRLLLFVTLAMADAGIHCWHYKYHFNLWRPILGIREYDKSMGPASMTAAANINADTDPFWRPLGAPQTNTGKAPTRTFTPPFPAYPSGHATFGAAAFQMVRLFLQKLNKAKIKADKSDDIAFDFVSDELNGTSIDPDGTIRSRHLRKFSGLHEAIYENSISRIFLGVHWRFDGTSKDNALDALTATDKIGGVPLGIAIADDIFSQMSSISPSPASARAPDFEATAT